MTSLQFQYDRYYVHPHGFISVLTLARDEHMKLRLFLVHNKISLNIDALNIRIITLTELIFAKINSLKALVTK